jgi:hypothetical protein
LLQCGRGLPTAEGDLQKLAGDVASKLQCGRGLPTAEGKGKPIGDGSRLGFNVAAVCRPRKVQSSVLFCMSSGRFNVAAVCRPRKGREPTAVERAVPASMWPRSADRGRNCACTFDSRTIVCFNVAAVCRPRKAGDCSRDGSRVDRFNVAAVCRPRKVGEPPESASQAACFNVAAVCRPRKGRTPALSGRGGSCFNVAAVCRPRKDGHYVWVCPVCGASMWPRSADRGRCHE